MTPVWRGVAERLGAANIATPKLDARLLVAHASGQPPERVLYLETDELDTGEHEQLDTYVSRRMSGEPVSRIVGKRGFWKHEFRISPATLDPRPDSETLVEHVLRVVDHESWREKAISILDLGTGSGCLLLSLLTELPHARGVGIDISPEAIATAQQNAAMVGCSERVSFRQGDWFAGLDGTYEIIISNPPYIPREDLNTLDKEVVQYDPTIALDGGTDGLDAYRTIIAGARQYAPQGWLVFECGIAQAGLVTAMMNAAGFAAPVPELASAKDLSGITRCVAARAQ